MSLVVLEYSYEGVLAEGGDGDEALVGRVGNRADEVVYGLVDFFGREVGRGGMGECVELIVLERRLLLVASPSKQLAGAGNFGNVGGYDKSSSGRVLWISYPRVFPALSTGSRLLSRMGLQKHTLHTMRETSGERPKLAGLPLLPMRELQEYFWLSRLVPW